MDLLPCAPAALIQQTRLILSSYRRWKGQSLIPEDQPDETLVRELFFAPFVVASAGTEKDPVLNYGNRRALDLWEMDWSSFIKTPGRCTAEPMEREARDRFLEQVRKNGYIDDYRGIRISSAGRRFEIQQAVVWNLLDGQGGYAGQAVTFSHTENAPCFSAFFG